MLRTHSPLMFRDRDRGPDCVSFKGQCGGLMPFLAGPRPCSFWEYFSGQALFVLLIVRETYWPFVMLLLIVPISVGYLLDRLQNRAA